MKILHTSDWHIGSHKGPTKDGVNLRAVDTINCIEALIKVAEEEKPELVLISGDIFHTAEVMEARSHTEVLQARKAIMKLSMIAKNVVVMRGTPNHDSLGAFRELQAHFENIDNVYVLTEPTVLPLPQANVAVLPGFDYGTFRAQHPGLSKEEENVVVTEELGKIIHMLKLKCMEYSGKPNVLMSHYTIPGCNTESGQTQFLTQFEPVISPDVLHAASFDLVAMGHIHRPQAIEQLQNVYYAGAVNALNFNDEGQERGFWIHNFTFSRKEESVFYKTPSREFLTIRWEPEDVERALTNPDGLAEEFRQAGVKDKIIRIIYSCNEDQKKAINKVIIDKALYDAGAFWIADMAVDRIEGINRKELSKFADPESNLIQYFKEKAVDPELIDKLVDRARPIISKALASDDMSDSFGIFIPKRIEVENYRNYEHESFDFTDISFCTINGANGAGKSSLFMDAILDCLFEEPREGSLTGWIRNDDSARKGSISFEFSLGEKTYRVVRTRAKTGKATLNLSEHIDNEWVNRSKEKYKDTQDEIVKVLGMDSLTFRSCALIMQDQYGLFLEASKNERIEVLSNLLGLDMYSSMEKIAAEERTQLNRELTAKKNTVAVHEQSIATYGNPEEELKAEEELAEVYKRELTDLTAKKEEKSLTIKLHKEAVDRRDRLRDRVYSIYDKKNATERVLMDIHNTIYECDKALEDSPMVMELAKAYREMEAKAEELSSDAAKYKVAISALEVTVGKKAKENDNIAMLTKELESIEQEIKGLMPAEDIELIESKAKEYSEAELKLNEARKKERDWSELNLTLNSLDAKRKQLSNDYKLEHHALELFENNLSRKADLLKNVDCVDIKNARCAFLKDAIEAKAELAVLKDRYDALNEKYKAVNDKADSDYNNLKKQMDEIGYSSEELSEIEAKLKELKPYTDKLKELKDNEQKQLYKKKLADQITDSVKNAFERLLELSGEQKAYEDTVEACRESAFKYNDYVEEKNKLKKFADKAAEYPVILERRNNAMAQGEAEENRLRELSEEYVSAREELDSFDKLPDITSIEIEIKDLTDRIELLQQMLESRQKNIGSIKHKLEEINRLKDEIADISKDIRLLSSDISEVEYLKAAFSKSGIPHQIIRTLVPRITEIASSILGQMTEGRAGIEFRLERELKSGKDVTELDIFIEEFGKSTLPYLSKSGGEKVRASLSVILALAEIKSSCAGIQLGMLFIDEPPFLDGEGIQAYCDALETIQHRYPELKIMAITHDPTMKARFPQSLDVIKTEHGSKVIY